MDVRACFNQIKAQQKINLSQRAINSTQLNSGEFNLRPQTVVHESAITQRGRTAAEEGACPV